MSRYVANIYMPMPEIQIKLEGDWERAKTGIDGIPRAIKQGYDKGTGQFSQKLLQIIQQALNSGGPPGEYWEPLSPNTIKTYAKKGLHDTTPWVRTGLLSRAIGVYNYGDRLYIGLPNNAPYPNIYGEDSGLTFVQLARLLETGSVQRHIPARPLFQPSFQAAGGRAQLRKAIITEIRRKLMPLGFHQSQVKW